MLLSGNLELGALLLQGVRQVSYKPTIGKNHTGIVSFLEKLNPVNYLKLESITKINFIKVFFVFKQNGIANLIQRFYFGAIINVRAVAEWANI